jgi:chitodextrinase
MGSKKPPVILIGEASTSSKVKLYKNQISYAGALIFALLFAIVGVHLLTGSHAASVPTIQTNPANPYNTQLGVMDSNGWGPAVSSYIKNAGVTWDRIDGDNPSLINSALGAGYNVIIITPENPTSAESTIDAYKQYGNQVIFEFYNEPWTSSNGPAAVPVATYAKDYQTVYNYVHRSGSGVTQPLLFMTIGDPTGSQGGKTWLDLALQAVPNLQVDAFSMHPYGEANQNAQLSFGVSALVYNHQDAVSLGFINTPWYVTEFGFTLNPAQASGSPATSNTAYVPSYAEQAAQLTAAYKQMMTLPWLRMIMYYQSHDDSTGWFGLFTDPITSGKDNAGEPGGQGAGTAPTPVIPRPAWNALLTFLPSSTVTPPPPPPDTTPPTVSLSAPANGATVSGITTISATASDNVGVSNVQFKLDGNSLGSLLTAAPYSYSWNTSSVADGTHTLTATASDAAGNNMTAASVTVKVSNTTGSNPTPTTVQNFSWNATTKKLSWSAYPGATAYNIATIHNPTTTRTADYTWPPVTGTSYAPSILSGETVHYGIEPLVKNSDGSYSAVAGSSWAAEINVVWPALADTTPPSQPLGLTASAASSSQINLKWTASTDNVGVSNYRIYRNNSSTPIATVTTTSYGNSGLAASTKYSYYVVAVDAAGNNSTPSATTSATTQAAVVSTATVEGVVKDSRTLKPIVGAYVTTSTNSTSASTASAYTNTQGQYVLAGIAPNTPHYYAYSANGYRSKSYSGTSFPTGVNTKNVSLRHK